VNNDVADDRREWTFLAFFIIEIDGQHRVAHLTNLDVPKIEILEPAAAQRVVLETQRHPEIRTVHMTVFSEYVANPGRDLASYGDAAVAVLHLAAADDYVF